MPNKSETPTPVDPIAALARELARLIPSKLGVHENRVETLTEVLRQVQAQERARCAPYMQHTEGCNTRNAFFGRREGVQCARCHGTGCVPSESCDDCPDCQETCPVCKGVQSPLICTCGLAAIRQPEHEK